MMLQTTGAQGALDFDTPLPAGNAAPVEDVAPVTILDAEQCRARLMADATLSRALCFLLWDRPVGMPFLCGVTNSRERMLSHLDKDRVRDGSIGLTRFQPDLLAFVMAQPIGFLGVSLFPFETLGEAKCCEHAIVTEFGRREAGGVLFNRRIEREG